MISGTEAAEIGLADYAVEQNEAGDAAYQRALTLAEEILPRGPVAVKMAKLAINKGIQVSPYGCGRSRGVHWPPLLLKKPKTHGLKIFRPLSLSCPSPPPQLPHLSTPVSDSSTVWHWLSHHN